MEQIQRITSFEEIKKELERQKYYLDNINSCYLTASKKENNSDHDKTLKSIAQLSKRTGDQIATVRKLGESVENVFDLRRASVHSEIRNVEHEKRDAFEEAIKPIYKGMAIANKYCVYDNSVIYILLYRQAGDIMTFLSKIPSIRAYYGEEAEKYHSFDNSGKNVSQTLKKQKIIKKICVITKLDTVGVARLFSEQLDGIVSMKYDDLKCLAKYALSACALHHNIFCEADAMRIIYDRRDMDEGQLVRAKMFNGVIDIERDLCIPHHLYKAYCKPKISDMTLELTNKLVKKEKIDVANSVIISPYSSSASMLEMSFWGKYVECLKKQGKSVYTFVKWSERPAAGTQPLKIDIDTLACLSSFGCKVVAVHSGESDIINVVAPANFVCLSIVKNERDRELARSRNVIDEINHMSNGATYIKPEHFEDDYILSLLSDMSF